MSSPATHPAGSPPGAPPADDPAAYVAEDRRLALVGGPPVDGRVRGAVLFADVSGFTAMTEALVAELGATRGAEFLAATLERVFGALIEELHRWRGSVLYFSGDAVTCWLEGDDGSRATDCGFAMQRVMDRVGEVVSPGGVSLRLRVKVAVAAGTASRFVAGDPAIQLIDVLAGSLMDEVAAAESVAEPGDVVVTEEVGARLQAGPGEQRRAGTATVRVARQVPESLSARPAAPHSEAPSLPEEEVRRWLLPPVYQRMRAGRGEFLAELRPAVPVFVRFGGLDFDADPHAPDRLDAFVVAVQRVVDGHGGSLLQLTVGDKGAYLYAVFGAPVAHENDAERACAAALEISGITAGDVVDVTVGVASGRLRSGTYGNHTRRTFCCLGDAVNLAARLMGKAEAGGVLVSAAVAAATGDRFEWGERRSVALKGRARQASAVELVRTRDARAGLASDQLPAIGRDDEVARVVAVLRAGLPGRADGPPGLVGVTAEVGAGKTRLLVEAFDRLRADGVRVVTATAPTRGTVPAYAGWWQLWRALLDVPPGADGHDTVADLSARLPAELAPRVPLLGALLGIPLPDTELTAGLDAKLRKASLEQLAVAVLAHLAARSPLVLALDDAHALDGLSRDLLTEVVRALPGLPVVLALGYRHTPEPLLGLGETDAEEVVLGPLAPADARALAERGLADLVGSLDPARGAGLADRVVARAEGNPLWILELCRYLQDRAVDPDAGPGGGLEDGLAELPDTLQGLVLGRLDLLEETPRSTAKVASVVGRRFVGDLVLRAWPDLGAEGDVREALQELQRRGLTAPVDLGTDLWEFTNGVLRDVAYESLPFATRERIHDAVVVTLESGDFGTLERRLDDLAHHAWHGSDADRKRTWLRRAGEAAQAGYANDTALLHYRRLLTVAEGAELADVHTRVGKVLELQAEWEQAETEYATARAAAEAAGDAAAVAWATTWAAEVARKRGRPEQARDLLAEAEAAFTALEDDTGCAQVWHIAGTLASQQGLFEQAAGLYHRSLEVRERTGDRAGAAALLSNLAIGAEAQGDYTEAEQLGERALAIRREIGDRWAVGVSQNNLGMLALLRGNAREAQQRFTESMSLHRAVGDSWMVALGHHNLGNAHRDLGEVEPARAAYAEALAAYRRFGDDWVRSLLYEDVALLLAASGEREDGWRLVGVSDALHQRTGTPRTPDVTARLEQALGEAAAGASLRAEGERMPVDRADRLVVGT